MLEPYLQDGVEYHALRTRQSGLHRFSSLHLLMSGDWSIQRGHDLAERIEIDVQQTIPNTTIFIHLEPNDDLASWNDLALDHTKAAPTSTFPLIYPVSSTARKIDDMV